jgi:protein gp37
MTTTKIQWTDETWNPVRGCTEISPGCAHCYAKTFAERWRGVEGHPYEQGFDVRLVPEKLDEPLRWKRPRMVFVNSMSDLFHEDVPDEFLDLVFVTMAMSPTHTFQVLTKRHERMRDYMQSRDLGRIFETEHKEYGDTRVGADTTALQVAVGVHNIMAAHGKRTDPTWPLPNVWLGVSVEDQKRADERIPLLLQTPAAVRFLSCEPLLGPINLHFGRSEGLPTENEPCRERHWLLDWVIVGGESGPGARPCNIDWIRDIVRQCKAASVPCFVKQVGSQPYEVVENNVFEAIGTENAPPRKSHYESRNLKLIDKKGGNPSEWPADLRIREFPK